MNTLEINAYIHGLNQICYLHEDLMSVAVDFYEDYINIHRPHSTQLNKLWGKPEFLKQCVISVREALILGTNSLTLDSSIPFKTVVEGCVSRDLQASHLTALELNPVEHKLSVEFFNALRKNTFSRIFEQNKEFNNISNLDESILNERYNYFMRFFG